MLPVLPRSRSPDRSHQALVLLTPLSAATSSLTTSRHYVTYHDHGYSTCVTAQRLVRTGCFRRFDRWESRGSPLEMRNPLRRCEIYLATLAGSFFMLSDPGFCLPILAPLAGTRRRQSNSAQAWRCSSRESFHGVSPRCSCRPKAPDPFRRLSW
jgi:hypothetical protein